MILNLTVKNQRLTLTETPFVAEDTEGYIKCVFNFTTEDWNGTVKTAHFKNPLTCEVYTQLLENDSCMVPPETLTDRGNVSFSLTGEKKDYRITTGIVSFFNADTISGGEPSDPTPSQYDQIIAAVAESISAAENAESIAESIQQQAESGAFKGDKGDIGPQGPQGEKGDKGDKGDTGEKGTGIDTWMTALDLSEYSSSSNAFNIFTLDDGAYIVTAGGYISNSSASAGTIEIDQGAYIVVNSSRATINSSNACYNIGISDNDLSGGMIPIYSEMNDALSSKADAIKIITRTAAGGNLNLQDKRDFRFEALTTLNFSLPDTVPDIFECNVTFESGETATILSYPADTIEFIGDECDADGDFVPAANTTYEINIKNLGYDRIRAFVKALKAQPVIVTPDYLVSARYNDWVKGAITNGVFQDSTSRIRSGHHFYATGTEVIVKIPSGYQMAFSFYSKSGNSYVYQSSLDGWQTGTATFTIADGVNYAAFMYGLTNNTVAEPADGLEVEFLIKQPAQI